MRADFDSEANALDLELVRFKHYDHQEQVDDDFCTVGFAGGRLVDVEIVAQRYGLDGPALLAAAKAALAAPDRLVTMDLSGSLLA
jgi:hypothetical protein